MAMYAIAIFNSMLRNSKVRHFVQALSKDIFLQGIEGLGWQGHQQDNMTKNKYARQLLVRRDIRTESIFTMPQTDPVTPRKQTRNCHECNCNLQQHAKKLAAVRAGPADGLPSVLS
ncbi:unnamed protein product [Polarella glacialis]|uniref:Uncharacterized protein n=1 Tax=Polarella glacialis TaxID=89957 RepID=A0A813FS37_POLGL|nr:unnamed protein product [Polarella glacialis]